LYAERERRKGLTGNGGSGTLGDGNPRFWGFSELGEKEFEVLDGKDGLEK
jgi:hypothetical protein